MVTVSIIGTAGRDKSQSYSRELYDKMIFAAKYALAGLQDVTLVSGGAALSDHVAVSLYLEGFVDGLILHLPCKWTGSAFIDTGLYDWRQNPGRTSNIYHQRFSNIVGIDSLAEISRAIEKGATVYDHYNGFHARNSEVAKTDYMLAFTWSKTGAPVDGGTLDTWNKSKAQKIHIDLHTLV